MIDLRRYIKTIALEQFINARPEEFGTQWSYEVSTRIYNLGILRMS